ncbi:hypothetical protein BgiBS90_029443, partial [Biomphalaria glabrata]
LHSLSCFAINADFHVLELRHCNDTMEFICETRRQELVEQATDKPQTCPSSWMPRNDFCYK